MVLSTTLILADWVTDWPLHLFLVNAINSFLLSLSCAVISLFAHLLIITTFRLLQEYIIDTRTHTHRLNIDEIAAIGRVPLCFNMVTNNRIIISIRRWRGDSAGVCVCVLRFYSVTHALPGSAAVHAVDIRPLCMWIAATLLLAELWQWVEGKGGGRTRTIWQHLDSMARTHVSFPGKHLIWLLTALASVCVCVYVRESA